MADLKKLSKICPDGVAALVAGVSRTNPAEGAALVGELGRDALSMMLSCSDREVAGGLAGAFLSMLNDPDLASFGASMDAAESAAGGAAAAGRVLYPDTADKRQWQAALLRVAGKRASREEREAAVSWMTRLFPDWRPEGGQMAQVMNDSSPSAWAAVLNRAADEDESYLERLEEMASMASGPDALLEMLSTMDRFAPVELVRSLLREEGNKERREKSKRAADEILKRAAVQAGRPGPLGDRRRRQLAGSKVMSAKGRHGGKSQSKRLDGKSEAKRPGPGGTRG